MKEIIFGNLDFTITDSYKIMHSRISGKECVCLFNEFSARPFVYKTCLRAEIQFEIENQNINAINKIDELLIKEYGAPDYIAHGVLKIWDENDFYIVHGMEEQYYQRDVHIIKISFQKPYLFMLRYDEYDKYVVMLDEIKNNWNLNYRDPFCVIDNKIKLWLTTENYWYFIELTKHRYAFYSSEKKKEADGIRLFPSWNKKGKYKDIQDLYCTLNSFFSYLEEYDPCLKKDN